MSNRLRCLNHTDNRPVLKRYVNTIIFKIKESKPENSIPTSGNYYEYYVSHGMLSQNSSCTGVKGIFVLFRKNFTKKK